MEEFVKNIGCCGVLYLARGSDGGALKKFNSFRESYSRYGAGIDHDLYIIYKGFDCRRTLNFARNIFAEIPHREIFVNDHRFDLGAYADALGNVFNDTVFFLNTSSEILGEDWLKKVSVCFQQPGVGMVSCSGSFEAPAHPGKTNHPFPNPHLRSNAFMMSRDYYLRCVNDHPVESKLDAHLLEHGVCGISQRVLADGHELIVVGRNGRGYAVEHWAESGTFRQGEQKNLLVGDNQTRRYLDAAMPEKRLLHAMAWLGV